MKYLFIMALCMQCAFSFAQTDSQTRYNSGYRQFFTWNQEKQQYELKDTEFEHTVIDIREINSKGNGYVMIGMTDDAKTRMYHGSITGYTQNDDKEQVWSLRSKILKSKLVYNVKDKSFTYSYESNGDRYTKIFIFNLSDPE